MRAAGGWLDFAEYMELALYAPALGYYSAGSIKLRAGRRFRDRAGDLAAVCALPGARLPALAPDRSRRRHPGTRRRHGRAGGRAADSPGRARATRACVTRSWRSAPICASVSSRRSRGSRPGILTCVEWLDELPGCATAGHRPRKRGRRRAAGQPLRRARRPAARLRAWSNAGEGFAWATRAPARELAAAVAGIERSTGGTWPEGYSLGDLPAPARLGARHRRRARFRCIPALRLRHVAPRVLPSRASGRDADLPLPASRPRRPVFLSGPAGHHGLGGLHGRGGGRPKPPACGLQATVRRRTSCSMPGWTRNCAA